MSYLNKSIQNLGGIMLSTARLSRQIRRTSSMISSRTFCSPTGTIKEEPGNVSTDVAAGKVSGFAKAFEKQSHLLETEDEEQNFTFASLLRNSKLMDVS